MKSNQMKSIMQPINNLLEALLATDDHPVAPLERNKKASLSGAMSNTFYSNYSVRANT